ncbi:MAG TPA: hypothetical protein VIN39_01125 [Candidatus Dormibacteraeota bacterium]
MNPLDVVVAELRRAAARSRGVRYFLHALLGSAAWVTAVLLAARLAPVEPRAIIAALGIPVAFLVAGIAWMVTRPQAGVLVRLADLRLGMKERLSTAWERRGQAGPLDDRLRHDALRHAGTARLAGAFPVRVHRGEASIIAALSIFALALAVVPNPMDQVFAQRQADKVSQARAAAALEKTKKKIAEQATPAPLDPQIQKILQDAQARIRQADSPRKALENITPAEQKLQQLSDPQTPARSSTAQNLANALRGTAAGRNAGQALASSPAKGAQALRDLASQLQRLSPADRDELARALANAAEHAQDQKTGASLNKASESLKNGDTASASNALNEAAGQLDSLQQQESNDQAVASAINGLEAARQELAGQADRDAGQSAQASASASASASAAASARANGNGNGSANGNGNGNGNDNGTGTGSGSGSGNGNGGTGSGSGVGSGSGSGSGTRSTERVYVPGQPVPGQSEDQPTPLGPGQDVPLSPYSQVINAYQQAALDAADQSLIPGSERDLVRQYFSQLGEGGS